VSKFDYSIDFTYLKISLVMHATKIPVTFSLVFKSLRLVCSSSYELLILGISVRIFFFNAVVSPCLLHDRI
jgi:hypothetical protein